MLKKKSLWVSVAVSAVFFMPVVSSLVIGNQGFTIAPLYGTGTASGNTAANVIKDILIDSSKKVDALTAQFSDTTTPSQASNLKRQSESINRDIFGKLRDLNKIYPDLDLSQSMKNTIQEGMNIYQVAMGKFLTALICFYAENKITGDGAAEEMKEMFTVAAEKVDALTAKVSGATAEEISALQGEFEAIQSGLFEKLGELSTKYQDVEPSEDMQATVQEGMDAYQAAMEKFQAALAGVGVD